MYSQKGGRVLAVKKKTCAYCHAYLFDDDDIVYCPDCGAPHHRDCWFEINHCANVDNHGKENIRTNKEVEESKSIRCSSCGTENSEDSYFCQHCGASLNNEQYDNTYTNQYVNDKIDGVNSSTVASYIRVNSQKYVNDFKEIDAKYKNNKKLSSCIKWNWSGFLFGYLWLFYRKCHKPAWVLFLISVISTILQTPLLALTSSVIFDIIGVQTDKVSASNMYFSINDNLTEIYSALNEAITTPIIIMFVFSIIIAFAVHLIIGLFGENIYKNNAINKIKAIEQSDTIESKQQIISTSGGVNIFMVVISWYLMNIISNYLMLFML